MVLRKSRYAIFRLPLTCGEMIYVGWVEAIDYSRALDRAHEEFGKLKQQPRCLYYAYPWSKFDQRKYGL